MSTPFREHYRIVRLRRAAVLIRRRRGGWLARTRDRDYFGVLLSRLVNRCSFVPLPGSRRGAAVGAATPGAYDDGRAEWVLRGNGGVSRPLERNEGRRCVGAAAAVGRAGRRGS